MIKRGSLPWSRRRHRHAQVHFPPLTGQEALLIVNLLDRVITALYRTHGDAMADLLACVDPGSLARPNPGDCTTQDSPAPTDDIDF